MPQYYIEFKTWAEGPIEVPWPFVWFEEQLDYRRRDRPETPISSKVVRDAFISMSEETCRKFLSEHVPAMIIGAVIEARDESLASSEVFKIFGYVEIEGCIEINASTIDGIAKIMDKSGWKPDLSMNGTS